MYVFVLRSTDLFLTLIIQCPSKWEYNEAYTTELLEHRRIVLNSHKFTQKSPHSYKPTMASESVANNDLNVTLVVAANTFLPFHCHISMEDHAQ